MMDASTTRNPRTPFTRNSLSTTASGSSVLAHAAGADRVKNRRADQAGRLGQFSSVR
jgi:hypothetical protein